MKKNISLLVLVSVLFLAGCAGDKISKVEVMPGEYKKVAELHVPRIMHTSTALDDGRILIVGGMTQRKRNNTDNTVSEHLNKWLVGIGLKNKKTKNIVNNILSVKEIELYDPTRNVVEVIGNLLESRYKHRVVLLDNRQILVLGGCNDFNQLDSIELFNVKTKKSILLGHMKAKRERFALSWLNNDEILISGGYGEDTYGKGYLDSCEILNIKTKKIYQAGKLNIKRAGHSSSEITKNVVLISGGENSVDGAVSNTELYYRENKTSKLYKKMAISRYDHQVIKTSENLIYIGGFHREEANKINMNINTLEKYNFETNKFSLMTSHPNFRQLILSELSKNSYFISGFGKQFYVGGPEPSYILDLKDNSFKEIPCIPNSGYAHTINLVDKNNILFIGGISSTNNMYLNEIGKYKLN